MHSTRRGAGTRRTVCWHWPLRSGFHAPKNPLRGDIHPFRGPIPEALGLIWQAAASVFPDSGLMHFAAASPGGVLGLFAGSAEQWAPRGQRARWLVVQSSVPALADEAVYEVLDPLLTAGSSPAKEEAR